MTARQMLARLGIVGGLWTLLNAYVGGHVLGPAALSGLPRILAWAAVLLVAWLPLVALATARRGTENGRERGPVMRLLDWAAYTTMGLSSLLIVSFLVTDLLRLPVTARVVLVVVSGAALLTLVGIVLARRPRVVRVTVPIADLPTDLAANVTPFGEATRERLAMITQALISRGDVPALAQTKAIGFLNGVVTKQALMLSFDQLFLLFGTAFVLSLPLLLLMHRSRGMPGGAGGAH